MRPVLALAIVTVVTLGCATAQAVDAAAPAEVPAPEAVAELPETPSPPEAAGPAQIASPVGIPAPTDDTVEPDPLEPAPDPRPTHFRIGFWVIDFFAFDREPRGSTVRFFDFRILRILEIGRGSDYQSYGFVEVPELLSLFALRREGANHELRVLDVQAIGLALVRDVRESEEVEQTHFLKLPIIGSALSYETDEEDPKIEHETYGFLYRRDVER